MANNTYTFKRDVAKSEWKPLPRDFKKGETVLAHSDRYGLCRDDLALGGVSTVMCSLDGAYGFTVPEDMLDGARCEYVSLGQWYAEGKGKEPV